MESPGGYQLVGRTLPVFDKHSTVPAENKGGGTRWLLNQFDRVQYYEVSEDELERLRTAYRNGQVKLDIREDEFDLVAHCRFLEENKASIEAFQAEQKRSFDEERKLWTDDAVEAPAAEEVPGVLGEAADHRVRPVVAGPRRTMERKKTKRRRNAERMPTRRW